MKRNCRGNSPTETRDLINKMILHLDLTGNISFLVLSSNDTRSRDPLSRPPPLYKCISLPFSLSHTVALVLHIILVLTLHLFLFYHVSSPHIPPVRVMGSQTHTRSCFLSRFSYWLVVVIHTEVLWDHAFLVPYTDLI
jgi:hypothetical protein